MGAEAVILVTFAVYLLALLLIGWWADRRYSGSYEGFATAGKSLGGWVAAVSSAASSESAWVMLGVSGLGYAKGLAAYWTAVGCVIGFACTSLFVVVQLRRDSEGMDVLTLGDYLERVVADPRHTIRIVSALVIAFFMSVYVVAQFMGTGKQMVGMGLMSYQQGVVLAAVIIGIYVLIMSTADSQLMMSATALVHDLWRPLFGGRGVTGRGLVIRTRVVIMLTSMAAMGMALLKPRVIYTFVLFAWGALGAAFTPVILLSLHWKRLSWQGALASFLLGPATVVIWKLAGLSETLYELIPGALISTVAAVLVSRATAKPD